ncbi:MAG TPA: hypothetical protein VGR87_11120 [Candidatus Limnocylindria bacterium]|jgi:hypothetical protein|nr:hypothetical protein [Candidatus Limnocylindria bacterium]
MGPVEIVMVGAGNRGYLAYGAFALRHPGAARFVAVAEPDYGRRARFAEAHGIPADRQLRSWAELAERPRSRPRRSTRRWTAPTMRARSRLRAHLMAFAAERARASGETVIMERFRRSVS